jgi:hypothetical protein
MICPKPSGVSLPKASRPENNQRVIDQYGHSWPISTGGGMIFNVAEAKANLSKLINMAFHGEYPY